MRPILQNSREVIPLSSALSVSSGNIPGQKSVNKFGRTQNADSGIETDIWNRANATDNQAIWVAPTTARIHTIASDSAADAVGGSGTSSVLVYYLPDWDTTEQTELISGDLNAGIAMSNESVIIHRMESIPQASSLIANAGKITATAATDGTVTAQMEVGKGQTEMAIYGIPSTQTAYMGRLYGNEIAAAGGSEAKVTLLFNPNPDVQTVAFLTKHTFGIRGGGTSALTINYFTLKIFPGPGILKLNVITDSADMDISGGYDLIVKDN